MMPLYSGEKEDLYENGTDEAYEFVFSGNCKWSVSSYTFPLTNPKPLSIKEIEMIEDGDHWDKTLRDKSILLNCEIFCNYKDIDDLSYAIYEHYDKGVEVVSSGCT